VTPEQCPEPHTSRDGCGVCGWDGRHQTWVIGRGQPGMLRKAGCTCGWRGRTRHGNEALWDAIADGDEHANEEDG